MGVKVDLGEYGEVDLGFDVASATQRSMNQYVGQGFKNALLQTGKNMVKGAAVGPFTAAPDIVGMLNNIDLPLPGMRNTGLVPEMSGDPIREVVGLDPKNPAGIAGEFLDPTNALVKTPVMAAKVGAKLASSKPVAVAGLGVLNKLLPTPKNVPENVMREQALFHGTPHKFDKFDLNAIGTGEGAQAYGHGLYFAENPGVARSYQSTLTRNQARATHGGKSYTLDDSLGDNDLIIWEETANQIPNSGGAYERSKSIATEGISSKEDAAKWLKQKKGLDVEWEEGRDGLLEAFDRGHLYEVDIPDETIDKMLDWDAPLSEQPESVRKALRQNMTEGFADWDILLKDSDLTGKEIYRGLEEDMGLNQKAVSELLNEAGIPGIRFYDGASRGRYAVKVTDDSLHRLSGGVAENYLKTTNGNVEKAIENLRRDALAAGKSGQQFADAAKGLEAGTITQSSTRNIVVFNPDDIRQVKRDGEEVYNALAKTDTEKLYEGSAYRVEPGFEGGAPRNATAQDVIIEEMERKSIQHLDEFGIDEATYDALKDVPADELVWVGRSKNELIEAYGPQKTGDHSYDGLFGGAAEDISDVSDAVKGGRVIYEDGDGVLVWKQSKGNALVKETKGENALAATKIGYRGKRQFVGATVYHSTDEAGAKAIREGGFKVVGDGYFGEAVSFTDDLDYSRNFGGVTTESRIKPGAKILDMANDADFQVWSDAQKRGVPLKSHKRIPSDKTWAEIIMEKGYDGLYDDGAGDLFIYNTDVIELVK